MHAAFDHCSRRRFLRCAAAGSAVLLAGHDALAGSPETPARSSPRGESLIKRIDLLTAVPLTTMRMFYHGLLGLPVGEESPSAISFHAGDSILSFSPAPQSEREPFYHFAFNITQNKVRTAREWLLQRTPLVPTPQHLRDPAFPDDVRYFRTWNAHSLFFFDPAYNIVEFIARHTLGDANEEPFSAADLRCISEIGFVVDDQPRAARALGERFSLTPYPQNTSEPWWAMGDEMGLLLCLPIRRVFGENTSTPKSFAVFPTRATIARTTPTEFVLDGYPYRMNA